MNSVSNINGMLAITDPDAGQTETWFVSASPMHGSLGGFSATATSTGSTLVPAGLTYTPATGYTGPDSFMISVSDGIATTTAFVAVNVRPLPTLSSTLAPAAVCDQSAFNYTPSSASAGASFAWNRSFTGGISNAPASGTGSISETLVNTTYYNIPVTYNYTIAANGCTNHQNVVVTIYPTPRLSSSLYDTTCTTATYSYIPVSTTAGTTYTWSRASVAGIAPATASGAGNINEILTSSNSTVTTVVYMFTLNANGCTATRNLNVAILPQPPVTSISTTSPSSVCTGVKYLNFGAGIAPPPGVTYSWSAANAVIWATGSNDQYCLVNFPYSGNASVTLKISGGGAGCGSSNTYAVNVTSAVSAEANVIYYNSQFIYQDNTVSAYQWGYDHVATLDSTIIPGANFQSYPVTGPDLVNRYYWVMTTKNSCSQKTYFNTPVAITNVQPASSGLGIYPNPAGNMVNIEVNVPQGNNTELTITNMLGQTVKQASLTGRSTQFDMAGMPAGCYLVTCSQNGVKMAVGRLIKN